MNSSIQDAHNLAWKLAVAIKSPDADVEALLESYAQERWDYVQQEIQPFTDHAERFETAPTFLREIIVNVGGKLTGMSRSAHAMARRLSMLDVEYRRSTLFQGGKAPIGKRVPNFINGDGHRLFQGVKGPAVLHAQCQAQADRLAEGLDATPLDADTAELARFFQRARFVALVRPDQIAAWVGDGDVTDMGECRAALGRGEHSKAASAPGS